MLSIESPTTALNFQTEQKEIVLQITKTIREKEKFY
jgi:hypothetical protein